MIAGRHIHNFLQIRSLGGLAGVRRAEHLAAEARLQQAGEAGQPGRRLPGGGGAQPRHPEHRAHRRAEGGLQH